MPIEEGAADEDSNSDDSDYVAGSEPPDSVESLEEESGNIGDNEGHGGDENGEEHGGDENGEDHSDNEDPFGVEVPEEMRDGVNTNRSYFEVGMVFATKEKFYAQLDRYAMLNGVNLKVGASNKTSAVINCEEGCPFRLYVASDDADSGFMVRTIRREHKCARAFGLRRASHNWIAGMYKDRVQDNPLMKRSELREEVKREWNVSVSLHKCKRAKKIIMGNLDGSYVDDFSKLEAYCNELRLSDPGTDAWVQLSQEELAKKRRVFKRMYVCFNAAKVIRLTIFFTLVSCF